MIAAALMALIGSMPIKVGGMNSGPLPRKRKSGPPRPPKPIDVAHRRARPEPTPDRLKAMRGHYEAEDRRRREARTAQKHRTRLRLATP
jgi:hypothetical protein